MKKIENKPIEKEEKKTSSKCTDIDCPIHGHLKSRGRIFEGRVIKKFPKRIVIEFERSIYVPKYERYKKSKTKIHARLPECMKEKINLNDTARVQECRPLSKIIHFVLIDNKKNIESMGDKK